MLTTLDRNALLDEDELSELLDGEAEEEDERP